MINLDHVFQAGSFIDYSKKLRFKDKNELLSLFEGWAAGKDFIERDKELILKLVEEYYERKFKEEEIGKDRKLHKHKNEISKSIDDIKQLKFDF